MIRTRGLACCLGEGRNLHFPDADVPQGGTLLLRGPSGSGKSTWLSLAAGLRVPSAGRIELDGQSVGDLSPVARDLWRAKHIGFLPQRLLLSDALNVADNLALVYFAAGLAPDRGAMDATLDALGVRHLASRRPARLSGGEAQRVALARALLLRPRVVLADEPTASLDDAACRAALELLQTRVQTCGATLVIATHDARVVQALPAASVLTLNMPGEGAR